MAPPTHWPLRIAHRGMPRLARENTLTSFALALARGAEGIELDVHATSEGVVVVHHDATLPNGTPINLRTRAELTEDLMPGAPLPTLADVCSLVKGRAELFVEIKGDGIEALVVQALADYRGAAAIHSFDHALIHRLARNASGRRLGILLETGRSDVRDLMKRTGALDLWPHHSLVTNALVEDVHAVGGRVIPWTVNEPHDIARMRASGVDGICTDDVTLLSS